MVYPAFISSNETCGLVSPYTLDIKLVIPLFTLRSADLQ